MEAKAYHIVALAALALIVVGAYRWFEGSGMLMQNWGPSVEIAGVGLMLLARIMQADTHHTGLSSPQG